MLQDHATRPHAGQGDVDFSRTHFKSQQRVARTCLRIEKKTQRQSLVSVYHIDFYITLFHPTTLTNAKRILRISSFIIQQIVTMPIYGKEALNICHPT